MMGLLDQLLGPVDLPKQAPMTGKGASQPPPSAPSWVQGSLAPGGMAPPPGMVNAQMGMQDRIGQAAAQQGVPSTGMQSSAPPGPVEQQMPPMQRVQLGKLW
jgi:hypothetical protein